MEDFERYGDDNRLEEEPVKKKHIVRTVICVLIAVFVLFFAFRLAIFDYYPRSMKNVYKTEALSACLAGGSKVYTQKIRAPYDDNDLESDGKNYEDLGSFFCDYLYVCPDAGEVQITLRMNESAYDRIAEKLGVTIDNRENLSDFSFRLVDNSGNEYNNLVHRDEESLLMYRYVKLVFDGIPLEEKPVWIRMEVLYRGNPYSCAAIYEDNEAYSHFTEVKVK